MNWREAIDWLQRLPRDEALVYLDDVLEQLTFAEAEKAVAYFHSWEWRARGDQHTPPGDWRTWLILAGRGWGKTATGANWCHENVRTMPGCRGAVIARTYADVVNVCFEGVSGILQAFGPDEDEARAGWRPDKLQLKFRDCIVQGFSSEKPSSLRGPQFHWLWADEMPHWEKQRRSWEQMPFVVRLPWPANPKKAGRVLVTTTPLPVLEIRSLLADPTTHVTRGDSRENYENLNEKTRRDLEKLRGTRLGRQEVGGEVLDDVPGALWTRANIDAHRVAAAPPMVRIVVAIDPATTSGEDSDETGIVAVGQGRDSHLYVLADESIHGKPMEWASAAVALFDRLKADAIVVETNQGGEMVASTLRTLRAGLPIIEVHASRGKVTRAEPVSLRYEKGEIHHVSDELEKLDDQLCTWSPLLSAESPDRLDALVWACTALEGGGGTHQKTPPQTRGTYSLQR